jgi:hypothetical protein
MAAGPMELPGWYHWEHVVCACAYTHTHTHTHTHTSSTRLVGVLPHLIGEETEAEKEVHIKIEGAKLQNAIRISHWVDRREWTAPFHSVAQQASSASPREGPPHLEHHGLMPEE